MKIILENEEFEHSDETEMTGVLNIYKWKTEATAECLTAFLA